MPQLLPLKRSSGSARKDGTIPHDHYFVWLDQVIMANLADLFPGMEIVEAHPFHVTRNADMVIQELEADDLLETIEESVRQRRFGSVVRVTVNQTMPPAMLEILMSNLEVDPKDIYVVEGPLTLNPLMSLYQIDRHDLKEVPFQPAIPPALDGERIAVAWPAEGVTAGAARVLPVDGLVRCIIWVLTDSARYLIAWILNPKQFIS